MINEFKQELLNSLKTQYGLTEEQTIFDLHEQGQINIQKSFETIINPDLTTFQAIVKTTAPSGVVRYERRTVEI